MQENELIEPLLLVLKQFLKANELNDPYKGGLSSYGLFLMISSFLQLKNYPKQLSQVNLGMILIDFMGTYSEFAHNSLGIYTQLPSSYGQQQQ